MTTSEAADDILGAGSARDTPSALPPDPETDDLDGRRRRRRDVAWGLGLSGALLVSVVVAIGAGPTAIPVATVWRVLAHQVLGLGDPSAWLPAEGTVVWRVRAPRVLLGAVVGAALAVGGVVLQALVRNVLADPYLVGVTSGASVGAVASILFGVGSSFGGSALTGSAFLGGTAAAVTVYLLARSAGQVTSIRLLLAGVAVGYVLNSATSFLIVADESREGARIVLFWLLGSLAQAQWSSVLVPAAAVLVTIAVLQLWARRFDALAIGDDTARTLGVSPARFRVQALAVVALCVGAAVAVAGGVAFVGLVIPHVARRLVGGEHRRVLPVAALLGAVFLVWSDVVARVLFVPQELPLGVVTALVGAPLLFMLIRRLAASAA